jgi:hypothetical protein
LNGSKTILDSLRHSGSNDPEERSLVGSRWAFFSSFSFPNDVIVNFIKFGDTSPDFVGRGSIPKWLEQGRPRDAAGKKP